MEASVDTTAYRLQRSLRLVSALLVVKIKMLIFCSPSPDRPYSQLQPPQNEPSYKRQQEKSCHIPHEIAFARLCP